MEKAAGGDVLEKGKISKMKQKSMRKIYINISLGIDTQRHVGYWIDTKKLPCGRRMADMEN